MVRRSRRQRGGESPELLAAREAYEADMNKIEEYKTELNNELSKPETSDEDKISIQGILEGLEEPPPPPPPSVESGGGRRRRRSRKSRRPRKSRRSRRPRKSRRSRRSRRRH